MKYNFLDLLGLSQKENDVYMLLITYGPLTIADIVSRSTLHRPYAYKTIGALLEKKIVTEAKSGKRKVFIAENPSSLRNRLRDITENAYAEIDSLDEIYTAPHLESIVKTVQGKSGVTSVFADLVESQKKGDIFYRYTSETNYKHTETYLPKDYRIIRDQKKLERFVISNWGSAEGKQKRLERSTKIIPKNESTFNQDCIQLIYGNKIAFIDVKQTQGIIIENKNLAQFQKEIFKLLYKRL